MDQHKACQKCKEKQFSYGHNISTEGAFVTKLFGNAGILVQQIVWVPENCCFLSNKINS